MHLKLEYQFLPHPYPEEPGSAFDQWCAFKLEVIDEAGQLIKPIFDIQWDVIKFVEWFIENEHMIKTEIAPPDIESTSLAKGINKFYEHVFDGYDFDEDDNVPISQKTNEALDRVGFYTERHQISHALRGVRFYGVYMGLYNGAMTISYYIKNNEDGIVIDEWNYEVDVNLFFETIKIIAQNLPALSNLL